MFRYATALALALAIASPAHAKKAKPWCNANCQKAGDFVAFGKAWDDLAARVAAKPLPSSSYVPPSSHCRTLCRPTVQGIMDEDGSMRCDTFCEGAP